MDSVSLKRTVDGSSFEPETATSNSSLFGRRMTPQSPHEALQPEPAPPPPPSPRRKRPTLSAVSGFLSFVLIAAAAGLVGLLWSERHLREPGPLPADKVVYIAPGTELPEIISELEHEGVIDSPITMNVALVVEGSRSKVKAGEYLFKQAASLRDVMETLVSGRQVLHAITVPEGLTSEQIVQRLRDVDVLAGDIKDVPKEGSLLPETYKVVRGMSRADLLRKMQDDQRRVVEQIWAHRAADLPIRAPYDLVTLASIVEKETGRADERPHVASVFINRLRQRMRLQSDPTIVYGLVGGKGTLGRGISRAELDKPTPYNTYTIDGLPPGPIANPGRAALEAVANPSRTQDLYFVADGSGGHVFSETLDQHVRNVQRWRQIERDAKDRAASEVDKAPASTTPTSGAKGDQRGALDDPEAFGELPKALAVSLPAQGAPTFLTGTAAKAVAAMSVAGGDPTPTTAKAARKPAPVMTLALAPGLDSLGLSIRGVSSPTGNLLDGPMGDDGGPTGGSVDAETFPVSATRRAEQKARAAKYGLSSGGDTLPPDTTIAPQTPQTPAATGPVKTAGAPPGDTRPVVASVNGTQVAHARIYDVSQGTPIDPLLDKTYDLNYPKTVPAIR
jgi:UPF0755 protein